MLVTGFRLNIVVPEIWRIELIHGNGYPIPALLQRQFLHQQPERLGLLDVRDIGIVCPKFHQHLLSSLSLHIKNQGIYDIVFRIKSDAGELSQTTMTVSENSMMRGAITINGTNGEWIERRIQIDASYQTDNYLAVYFAQTGIDVDSIHFVLKKRLDMGAKRDVDIL